MGRFFYKRDTHVGQDYRGAHYWTPSEDEEFKKHPTACFVMHITDSYSWMSIEDVYLSCLKYTQENYETTLSLSDVVLALETLTKLRFVRREFQDIATLDDYQVRAGAIAQYPTKDDTGHPIFAALGLVVKVGQLAERIQKSLTSVTYEKATLSNDLGETLWYVSELARKYNFRLSDVAIANIQSAEKRKIINRS